MRTATQWRRAGDWPIPQERSQVTLAYADRAKRRLQLTDDAGEPFLLDLARAVRLDDGDGLQLQGGGFIRVTAASETLAEVEALDATHLARLAWHIGNRHTAAEIVDATHLRIAADSVLEDMLRQLGAIVRPIEAPFRPEGGAYGQVASLHSHAH